MDAYSYGNAAAHYVKVIMYSGEFRVVREHLGLSRREIAELLAVSEGTVQNWEKGKYTPPPGVAAEVHQLEVYTRNAVDAIVAEAAERKQPMLLVWRQDADMPPGRARTLGASWWRGVAARVRERVDDLVVAYADELDELTGSREATLRLAISVGAV
ncbi:hypothetical protein BW737_007810 [Actinomyces ruminis]|uniref:HTH cro/C1-type domain-containing protein n=1 Tax=Actinomyces ruminis TaxID=1937003 RepID=A0ABX4MC69_9ACTO|nr:hypothetical protein BW737_007810 [Actinomyces ruminis]